MASVLKTEEVKASGGSNPSPSASKQARLFAVPVCWRTGMRTTRAPNNGKNAPPVRACRFARACIAREDRPRRGKAPWQTARFACRLARCACRSSSQKSHFAAIFGSPIFFPSGVSAVCLTFRQATGSSKRCSLFAAAAGEGSPK